jgi:hypothetical protein
MAHHIPADESTEWFDALADDPDTTDRLPTPTPRRVDRLPAKRRLRDENGRFLGRSRKTQPNETSAQVAFERAMIDTDADLFLAEQHRKLEMTRTLLEAFVFNAQADQLEDALAVKAGMLVRFGHQDGRS